MRVRFISGHQTGDIVEMGAEAAILLSNRIVELVPDPPPPPVPAAPEPVAIDGLIDDKDGAALDTAVPVDTVPAKPKSKPTTRRKRR